MAGFCEDDKEVRFRKTPKTTSSAERLSAFRDKHCAIQLVSGQEFVPLYTGSVVQHVSASEFLLCSTR
jgi:hypothetical protein